MKFKTNRTMAEEIEKPYNKEIIKTRISNIIRLYGKESIGRNIDKREERAKCTKESYCF